MKFLIFVVLFSKAVYCDSNLNKTEAYETLGLPEINFDEDFTAEDAAKEFELQKESYYKGNDLINLLRGKYKLINGDLKIARTYLNRINWTEGKLLAIKFRYLAIIEFLEGNYVKSLKYLNDKSMSFNFNFKHICLLKMLNEMGINDLDSLTKNKESCLSENESYSKSDLLWIEMMIKLKYKDYNGIKRLLFSNSNDLFLNEEKLKLWPKMGLFLNYENEFESIISTLPESSYQSKRFREILAFIYLRSNKKLNYKKAINFIEDIDSANAENIKGNVNLINKEYELAFGHFKLALLKKNDSTNSLERAIPLAWILNEWNEGKKMLKQVNNKNLDTRKIKALEIAFLIREKKYEEASLEIKYLKRSYKNSPPFEVEVMESYVTLLLNAKKTINNQKADLMDKKNTEFSSEAACKNFDGFSCWASLQYGLNLNFESLFKSDKNIPANEKWNLEQLKQQQTEEIIPLIEKKFVNQKDIDELDGLENLKNL